MLDFIISQSLCFFFPYPVYLLFLSFCLSNVKKSMIIIRAIKKRIRIILSVAVIISSACLIVTIFFITILNSQSINEKGFSKRLSSFVKKSASSVSPEDEFLIKHPVFRNFHIMPPAQKKNVRLLSLWQLLLKETTVGKPFETRGGLSVKPRYGKISSNKVLGQILPGHKIRIGIVAASPGNRPQTNFFTDSDLPQHQ